MIEMVESLEGLLDTCLTHLNRNPLGGVAGVP